MLSWTLRQVESKNRRTREKAIQKLLASGDKHAITRALDSLLIMLKSGPWDLQQIAATALGQIGDTRAVGPLVAALDSSYRDVWEAAVHALELLGWQPVNNIQRAQRAIVLREWKEIMSLRAVGAVTPLIAALKDKDSVIRQAAAEVLVKIGSAAAPPLVAALNASVDQWEGHFTPVNLYVPQTAAEILGRIGDERAVAPLVAALKDREKCQAAEKALGRFGSAIVVPLGDALKGDLLYAWGGIKSLLWRFGDARVATPLINLAHEDGWRAQEAIDLLHHVLELDATNVASKTLHAIVDLDGISQRESYRDGLTDDTCLYYRPVDCSKVRQFAQ